MGKIGTFVEMISLKDVFEKLQTITPFNEVTYILYRMTKVYYWTARNDRQYNAMKRQLAKLTRCVTDSWKIHIDTLPYEWKMWHAEWRKNPDEKQYAKLEILFCHDFIKLTDYNQLHDEIVKIMQTIPELIELL